MDEGYLSSGDSWRDSLLAEYRCRAKGCLLLRVWQTPNGPEFVAPAHRLSDRYTLARHLERSALADIAGSASAPPPAR